MSFCGNNYVLCVKDMWCIQPYAYMCLGIPLHLVQSHPIDPSKIGQCSFKGFTSIGMFIIYLIPSMV